MSEEPGTAGAAPAEEEEHPVHPAFTEEGGPVVTPETMYPVQTGATVETRPWMQPGAEEGAEEIGRTRPAEGEQPGTQAQADYLREQEGEGQSG